MKKYLLPTVYCLLLTVFFSCKEIQPVTIGGVSNVKLINLSKEGIEFDFDMKINNPNSVGVTVFPSSFDANVGGINVGKIKLAGRTRIKAKGEHTSTFHIKSDFSKLGITDIANVLPMIISKKADISLKGNLRVGKLFYKKKFPVELNKTIPLSK
ncbi:MAG: LEA type 2 family protein [Bacteroidia bacterium]